MSLLSNILIIISQISSKLEVFHVLYNHCRVSNLTYLLATRENYLQINIFHNVVVIKCEDISTLLLKTLLEL